MEPAAGLRKTKKNGQQWDLLAVPPIAATPSLKRS
jgi:hypothetical protein